MSGGHIALPPPIGGERQAFTAAAGVWLAVVAALWVGVQDPWWAAISAWIVANPDRNALVLKSLMRLAGTFVACVIGYQVGLFAQGTPFVQALALFALVSLGTYMRFRSRFGYAWLLGSVTVGMAIIGSIQAPADLFGFVVFRGTEISIGVVAALASALIIGRDVHGPPTKPAVLDPAEDVYAAIIGGLMPVVILVVWSWLDLPSLLQILISAVVVLDRDVAAMRVRGLQRILGCILGGAGGLVVVAFGVDGFVPWSIVFIGGLMGLAHLHNGTTRYTYVGTQGGLGLILAMVTGAGPPDTIEPVVERLAGMLIGVVLLVVVVALMRPILTRVWPRTATAAAP